VQTFVRAVVVENFFARSLRLANHSETCLSSLRTLYWSATLTSITTIMYYGHYDITCTTQMFSKYSYCKSNMIL